MKTTLISVIVPVYNVEHYLVKCIESICQQSYPNLDIILVDDGSTDQSGCLCDSYALKDNRIRVIHKQNGGLSDARNVGINAALGTWYLFVDSDDYLDLNTAESLLEAAIDESSDIAVCNMLRVYEDNEIRPFYRPSTELRVLDGEQRFETLRQPSVCNKLFRAELFENVRFPRGKFYEDTFIYHVLAFKAKRIVLTGKDGYYYLSRGESILGQPQYTDKYFDFIEAVYERAVYLYRHNITTYGEEACLSLYAAVAKGEKYIPKSLQNAECFRKMWKWYHFSYKKMMSSPNITFKQKLRLFLLKYTPRVHCKLY